MAVATVTETLRTLHRIHRQLEDLRDRIAAGPRQIAAHTKHLETAEASRADVQERVKQAKLAADQKQLQLRSAEAKILDLEGKLNACKTNREYQLLGEQIAADRMATKVLEDEILEGLETIDTIKATLPGAEQAVAAAKKHLDEVKARVAKEATGLEAEVHRVRGELDATERELSSEARSLYDRSVKQKGADAMAPAEGDCCGGCFQQITGKMASDLLLGHAVMCRSCGRLLYTPESRPTG
ncbi:MAG: zinc ribbon domain-containing protein [Planctomycetia bacterium]